MTNIQLMTSAPNFTAIDSEGKEITLSNYAGKKNVVISFNRGFFCPYCRRHMAQLRNDYQKFIERDTELIAVGPEEAPAFTRWWRENKMPFIGIPDPKHLIAKVYNQKFALLRGGRMPALAVIDKGSNVRMMHYANLPSDIPTDSQVLGLIDEINKEVAV